jgi:hypothetical protein
MKPVARRVAAGRRIREAVSTSYFPLVRPAPEPATLTLVPGNWMLDLPVRTPAAQDARLTDLVCRRRGHGRRSRRSTHPKSAGGSFTTMPPAR